MKEVTVTELKEKRDNDDSFVLLDVREPHEYYIADIPDTTRIPLGHLGNRLDELNKEKEIIVMCRSGQRSANATQILDQNGFQNAANLKGGILAWSKEIDPSVPEY